MQRVIANAGPSTPLALVQASFFFKIIPSELHNSYKATFGMPQEKHHK